MARMNSILKESIQIAVFLIVVGSIVYLFWIYPLNRVSDIFERPELDQISLDSLPPNNPEAFVEAGIENPDTIRIQTDGRTSLAGVYLPPQVDSGKYPPGTVILLHDEHSDRTSMIPLGKRLNAEGYAIVFLDQRTSGYSSGRFHGDGQVEATDLIESISWLDLRTRVYIPLTVIGYGLGGEAALIASAEDNRINRVLAVNPYLTSERMQALQKAEHDLIWFPFYNTVMWWWYNTSSSYTNPYREIDQIMAVKAATMLMMPAGETEIPEVNRLAELSGDKLTVVATPESPDEITEAVIDYLVPGETEQTETE